MRALCTVCSIAVALASANPEEVFAEAEARWADGDMEGVIEVFERASEDDPQPEYLFGRARAEVRLERCDEAVEHLEAFLRTDPPAFQREAADIELEKCGVDPGTVDPAPATPKPPPPSAARPDLAAPIDTPRHTDRLGWGLIGTGGAMLLVGATLFAVGASRVWAPGSTADEQAYRDRTSRGQRIAWSGVGVGGLGTAVLVGGIVRLVVASRRAKRTTARVR